MNLQEIVCTKIVSEKKIDWFKAEHAKTITALMKYERLFATEIQLLTQTEAQKSRKALEELLKARLLSFNGEKYFIADKEELLNKLMKLASEKEKCTEF